MLVGDMFDECGRPILGCSPKVDEVWIVTFQEVGGVYMIIQSRVH